MLFLAFHHFLAFFMVSFTAFCSSLVSPSGIVNFLFSCSFFLRKSNNVFYLLFCFRLTQKRIIIIVRHIRTYLRPLKDCLYHVTQNDLQRLTVLLIHGKEKEWHHNHHHPHNCRIDFHYCFEQKEGRYSNESRQTKTDQLSFCQIEHHLAFYFCQVSRDTDIRCCHNLPP